MIRFIISCCLTLLVLGSLSAQINNLIEVKENGKWGLYDFTTSKVVLEPQYDLIGQRSVSGIRIIKDDLIGLVSNTGELITEPLFLDIKGTRIDSFYIVILPDSTKNILDINTDKVILPVNNYSYAFPISQDYFMVGIDGFSKIMDRNGKYIINKKNKNLISNTYLQNHIILQTENNLQGMIQLSNGKETVPPIYQKIEPISDTYSKVIIDSVGYKVINHLKNEVVINEKIANIIALGKDYLILDDFNNKQYLYHIRSKNKYPLRIQYDNLVIINENYIRSSRGTHFGLIDFKGREILPAEFQLINSMKIKSKPNLILIKKNDLSGIYNPITKKEILPTEYKTITKIENDFIIVDHYNGKGLYNKHFEQLIKPEYNRIQIKENSIKARKEKSVEIFWLDDNQRITSQENYNEFYTLKIGYRKSAIIDSEKNPKKIISFPDVNYEWVRSPDFHTKRAYKAINSDTVSSQFLYKANEETGTHFAMVQVVDIFSKRNDLIRGLCNKKHGFNPFHLFDGNRGVFLPSEQRFTGFRFDDFKQNDLSKMAVILEDGSFGMIAQDGTWLLDERGQPLRASYIEKMQNGMMRYAIGGEWTVDKDSVKSVNPSFHVEGRKIFSEFHLYEHYTSSSWKNDCYLKNAKWGYIGENCKIIIPAQYEHASAFKHGKSIVSIHGKIACIDKENTILQPAEYSDIKITEHGTLILEKKNTENINYRMNKNAVQIFKDRYSFSDELFDGLRRVKKDGKYGCINEVGEIIIPLKYDSLGNFNEGFALAKNDNSTFIINKTGKELLKNTPYNIKSSVVHQLILVEENSKYGFIDINGKVVLPIKYIMAFPFQKEGLARVVLGRKTGLIDNTGHFVLEPKDYELVFPFDENGLAIVQHVQYGLKGIINSNGTAIIKPYYEEIEPFNDGYAIVKKDNKFGFINLAGKEVIPTTNYEVYTSGESIMAIKESIYAFWEFRDSSNQRINKLKFTKPAIYQDGHSIITIVTDTQSYHRCLVNIAGDTLFFSTQERQVFAYNNGLIGIKKKTVITADITKTSYHFKMLGEVSYRGKAAGYRALSAFHEGVAIVRPTGNYGLMDKHGNYITSLKYKYILKNADDSYTTIPEKLYGYTDKNGDIVLPVVYDYINGITRNNRHIVHLEKGDQIGYSDISGNWIWEMSR